MKQENHSFIKLSGRDIFIFVLSLLLAFSVWLIHNLSNYYSQVISVSVYADSNIPGHQAESANSAVVTARCKATGFRLLRLRNVESGKGTRVFIAPTDLKEVSEEVFSISQENLEIYMKDIFGDGVQLEFFVTKEVEFRFPVENYKKVPVQIVQILDFKPQYMAMSPMRVEPDSVLVYGEPIHLANVEKVYTQTISLEKISSGRHGVVKLDIPSGVRLSNNEVNYTLDVTRYVEMKSTVKVGTRNVPVGKVLSVYPSSCEVTFRCAFPMGVDPTENVELYVDYNDFARSRSGRCVPKFSSLQNNVIDYRLSPEVLECVETLQ